MVFCLHDRAGSSVVRASAMLSLGLLSYGMQRPCPLWQPWAASALLLTALQPEMLFDIGFQMSYNGGSRIADVPQGSCIPKTL
jgi:predicted membrane metal-binding protein